MFVHFWGTWCAPCEAELPEFVNFIQKNQDKGVKAILIIQDEEAKNEKVLKKFWKFPSFTVLTDKSGRCNGRFGTVKVPETYLFS